MRRYLTALLAGLVAAALLVPPAVGAQAVPDRAVATDLDGVTVGRSMLIRSADGFRARITTGGVEAGDAYTVWAVVFNSPENCVDGCGSDDLANPDAEAYSLLGTGGVARSTVANFGVRIAAGDQLTDPLGAEIHFVVRSHGPAIPGMVEEQTTTLNGGCPPNECVNLLFAIHE